MLHVRYAGIPNLAIKNTKSEAEKYSLYSLSWVLLVPTNVTNFVNNCILSQLAS